LPSDCFHKNKNHLTGFHHYCKNCRKIHHQIFYDKIKNDEDYKKTHRESTKKSYLKNKEKRREYHKKYRKKKLEDPTYQAQQRQYRSEYSKNKYQTDVQYKLANRYRKRFKKALKQNYKKGKTLDYLGCSLKEYKEYMESKFQEGMSWDNHGFTGWHIDHIIPCCQFDLTNEEEIKKCFHYTNLQPLWAEDNLRKNKIRIQ